MNTPPVAPDGGGLLGCADYAWTRGLEVALAPEWEQTLRERRDALAEADTTARAEAGLRFSEIVAEPRREFLAAVLAAVQAGQTQVDIATALGVGKSRVSQWVAEARGDG